ncbi:MAG: cytochrome C oxidase subunit IV family protein [Actinomycetota bacterium]
MSEAETHKHPSEIEYVKIAIILAVVTAAEVGVYYVEALKPYLKLILSVMMVVKFVYVASWFMHLKFDSHVFRRFFILGIVLALFVFGIVLWTFTFVISDLPA